MNKMDRNPNPIPEEFPTEEAAAEFWDTHSVAGYEESLEPVDFEADIQTSHYEIEVDEESFNALRETSQRQKKPIKQIVSGLLKEHLTAP